MKQECILNNILKCPINPRWAEFYAPFEDDVYQKYKKYEKSG